VPPARRPPGDWWPYESRYTPPPLWQTVAIAVGVVLALVANGRPIGAGDTRPTERVAASLVQSLDFDLDEFPEVEPPFVREAGGHRVSIYPVLSAVLATPVFAAARLVFELDETGSALAGKAAAALFSGLAAALLFLALARLYPVSDARTAALLFALGTSVVSTSQALWQHPAAVLFLSLALLMLVLADHEDDVWAGRAGLPLALAVAARHADVALVGALALAVVVRWPRRAPALAAWAAGPIALVAAYQWSTFGSPLETGFGGTLAQRFAEPWGYGQVGLLFSPAKGLFVFTPLALVALLGLARAIRRGERFLPLACLAGALAHVVFTGRWSEWHGGESWGPRLLTDLLPLLFLFLPPGFDALPRLGPLLAALSVGVQVLGAFGYDYRWERLHQRPPAQAREALWDLAQSPIPFALRERVLILAAPGVRERRAFVSEHPLVLFGPEGSRIAVARGALAVVGSDATLRDAHLQRGARVQGDRLRLRGRWDGVFFRVRQGSRQRRLELRVVGRGNGVLYVGERSFRQPTRWKEYPMAGSVRIRHPYYFPESGGGEVVVTLGKSPGEADLESVSLVPPGEPENVIRLP
jgi:hypothetical protein